MSAPLFRTAQIDVLTNDFFEEATAASGPIPDLGQGELGLENGQIVANTHYDLYNAGTAAVIATNNFWGEPTTTELSNNVRNLTNIYDSQDNASVGQVLLKP